MKNNIHEFLSDFIKTNKVQNYLEIGTREGDSLGRVVSNNTHLENIFVSDLWGPDYGGTGRGSHAHISQLLEVLHYNKNITFLDGDSKTTIPALHDQYSNYFDLIVVDGDHSYDGGMADLVNVLGLCKHGGTIVFDDINHPAHKYLESCFDSFVNDHQNEILSSYKNCHELGYGVITKK